MIALSQTDMWRCSALAAAVLISMPLAGAAPYVVQPSGQKIEGQSVRAMKDGQIVLTTSDGQLTFPKGTKVVVDTPADYDKGVQMLQKGQYDEAIRLMSGIVEQYRFLGWDNKASRILAAALVGKEDFKAAVKVYDELLAEAPEARNEDQVMTGFMRALAGLGDEARLLPLLNQAISTGPRGAAAQAQVIRAKLNLTKGDLDSAIYDLLRTVEYFRQESEVQAEAIYRLAECFEKRGDARAFQYYARLVKEYPQSPYAAQARARQAAAGQ